MGCFFESVRAGGVSSGALNGLSSAFCNQRRLRDVFEARLSGVPFNPGFGRGCRTRGTECASGSPERPMAGEAEGECPVDWV